MNSPSSMYGYWLFEGDHYYPQGGFEDFAASFNSLEEAKFAHFGEDYTWAHIYDTSTRKVTWECHNGEWTEVL